MPTDRAKPFPLQEIQGPDYRPTGQMPAALRMERLVDSLVETVSKLDTKVDSLVSGLTTVAADVSVLKTAEQRRESEARKHSGEIRAVGEETKRASQENLEQNAVLANVVTKLDELDKKTDYQTKILEGGKKVATTLAQRVWTNAKVRGVAKAIGAALLLWLYHWLDTKGIKVTP